MYYDGGDYERASTQFRRALEFRPDHFATRLGYAYSLLGIDNVKSLLEARKQFEEELKPQKDLKNEVKRVYGLALTHRRLASLFSRRADALDARGRGEDARQDRDRVRRHADQGIACFQKVIDIDATLAETVDIAPFRVSASLAPDAHAGIAACEILLLPKPDLDDPGSERNQEIERRISRVQEHITEFARVAAMAREFWTKRRERLLVVDPVKELEDPGTKVADPLTKERYEERIARVVEQEVTIRTTLFNTLVYINRFPEAIEEATRILELDPNQTGMLFERGKAYVWLVPPNYAAAVQDLKEYRRRQDLGRLTDELVELNRKIMEWERKAQEQQAARGSS
jgi:tetratricopeptide (TPR) repeat protein